MTRPDRLRLNLKQALARRRMAKRALVSASGVAAIREASGAVMRTEECATFWVKHYRENRVFREMRRAA